MVLTQKSKDITGQRFGRLIAIKPVGKNKFNQVMWLCKCDCGNEKTIAMSSLKSGASKSCGCLRKECAREAVFLDLTRERFGRWAVVSLSKTNTHKTYWNCKCDCGTEKEVRADHLVNGCSLSCGCLSKEKATTHGKSKTRIYKIWLQMRRRCYDSNQKNYELYGGRGITVCDEWEHDFMTFYNWAMINGYKEDLTLDRIDVNGNYCPENCRWATKKVQANNRRNNHLITHNGETHTVAEWSEIANIPYVTLEHRINAGWNTHDALTTPIIEKYSHRK